MEALNTAKQQQPQVWHNVSPLPEEEGEEEGDEEEEGEEGEEEGEGEEGEGEEEEGEEEGEEGKEGEEEGEEKEGEEDEEGSRAALFLPGRAASAALGEEERVGPEQVGPEQVGPEQVGPERRSPARGFGEKRARLRRAAGERAGRGGPGPASSPDCPGTSRGSRAAAPARPRPRRASPFSSSRANPAALPSPPPQKRHLDAHEPFRAKASQNRPPCPTPGTGFPSRCPRFPVTDRSSSCNCSSKNPELEARNVVKDRRNTTSLNESTTNLCKDLRAILLDNFLEDEIYTLFLVMTFRFLQGKWFKWCAQGHTAR
ncbi:uncharacterized protein LOC141494273 [Macrotis lagotis]|uniref:uncharacterized protein LOC141494273 n=1 Tax=Macrotis lagotis TaxID=92651 RepID=UPI003D68E54A